jgi:hypothetical protein
MNKYTPEEVRAARGFLKFIAGRIGEIDIFPLDPRWAQTVLRGLGFESEEQRVRTLKGSFSFLETLSECEVKHTLGSASSEISSGEERRSSVSVSLAIYDNKGVHIGKVEVQLRSLGSCGMGNSFSTPWILESFAVNAAGKHGAYLNLEPLREELVVLAHELIKEVD